MGAEEVDPSSRSDRIAYAWMDLAAERQYKSFLALREWYWLELDKNERLRAQQVGQELYATFGDEVAKRRLVAELARGLKTATGSRVGSIGYLRVIVPSANGPRTIDGTEYYAERYWKIDQYLAWQDALWGKILSPSVEVGEVQPEATQ